MDKPANSTVAAQTRELPPIIEAKRKPVDECPRFESCGMTLPEGLKR